MDKYRVLAVMDSVIQRSGHVVASDVVQARTAVAEVYARVERLETENERMENLLASGVHSCGPHCERLICVMRRERDAALADLAALRARVDEAGSA